MSIRSMVAKMLVERGRPLTMEQVIKQMTLEGYPKGSIYDALCRMRGEGEIRASGTLRARRWHVTPKTHNALKVPMYKPPKPPKAAKPKREEGPRPVLDEEEDKPFVHKLVPYGQWAANGSVSQGTRWVFDLGGRA